MLLIHSIALSNPVTWLQFDTPGLTLSISQVKRTFKLFPIIIVIVLFSSFTRNEKNVLSPQNTVIVATKNYPIGVRYLYKWLNKIYKTEAVSNQNFSVLREFSELKNDNDTSGRIVLSIGDNHFNHNEDVRILPPYSFIIKRKGNLIIIKGPDDTGTNLGITYFLDHYCGVRFYMPGDLFTSMPETNAISLPAVIDIIKSPFSRYVFSTGFWGKVDTVKNDVTQWDSFWALMNGLTRKNWGSHQQTLSSLFFDSTIRRTYPEIYPTINGKRYFPSSRNDQNFEPDFASQQLVNASLEATVKYFKAHPDFDYIAFSVMDGGGYSKEGEIGKFLRKYPQTVDGATRGYTDAYIQFLNNFAKELPAFLLKNGIERKKTIVYISYSQVRDIPKEKLNASILPVTVYHLSNSIADSFYFAGGALSKWAKVTSKIGNDDWAEGKGFIYPRIYSHMVSNFVKTIQQYKFNFQYAHIEAYPNWALDGPKYYEMAKIYWNPDINIDSLRAQFCSDLFGNASKPMQNYFNEIESISTWLNNHSGTPTHMFNYIGQLALDDTRIAMVKQSRRYLEEAARVSGITADERRRIDFFSKGFKISESFFYLYNSKTVDNRGVDELKGYLKNIVAGNPLMLNIATDKNFLNNMNALIDQIVKAKK